MDKTISLFENKTINDGIRATQRYMEWNTRFMLSRPWVPH